MNLVSDPIAFLVTVLVLALVLALVAVAVAVRYFVGEYRTLLGAIGRRWSSPVRSTAANAVTLVAFYSIIRLFAGINRTSLQDTNITLDEEEMTQILLAGIGEGYRIMPRSNPHSPTGSGSPPHLYTVVLVVLPESEADIRIVCLPGDSAMPPKCLRTWRSGNYVMKLYTLLKNDQLVIAELGALWVNRKGEAVLTPT